MNGWLVSRRLFLTRAASVVSLFGVARQVVARPTAVRSEPAGQPAEQIAPPPDPVVSFHMDQPYLDMTGTAIPYIPPAGTRSGQPLAELSVEEFYACFR